jgi:hypothetical protein
MTLTSKQRDIVNIVLMQGVWFACVLGGTLWGWIAATVFLLAYYWLFSVSIKEALCIVAIAAIGFSVDSCISMMKLMIYSDKNWLTFIPLPGWMAALWLSFATLFFHGLQWMRTRLLISAVLGAIGGSVTYYTGSVLQAVKLGIMPDDFFMTYGALWAIMTPLFVSIAASIDVKK